jgi:hypothetical protein
MVMNNLNIINQLPEIEYIKWRRYEFESESRYYVIILQQNIFHEWIIVQYYGGKYNKLGNTLTKVCASYEDAVSTIGQLRKKRKSRKYILKSKKTVKMGLNYEKIGLVIGDMV